MLILISSVHPSSLSTSDEISVFSLEDRYQYSSPSLTPVIHYTSLMDINIWRHPFHMTKMFCSGYKTSTQTVWYLTVPKCADCCSSIMGRYFLGQLSSNFFTIVFTFLKKCNVKFIGFGTEEQQTVYASEWQSDQGLHCLPFITQLFTHPRTIKHMVRIQG